MKILILKPSSLGDVVQALPVLRLLKQHLPQSQIYWWIHAGLAPLLQDDPDLVGIIPFERHRWAEPGRWRNVWHTVLWMREQSFDWVIDLQGLARSGVFAWLAHGKLTIGLDEHREGAGAFYDLWASRRGFHTHAVDWYLRVLPLLGVPVHQAFQWLPDRPEVAATVRRKWPVSGSRWIVLQPGARWLNKRWPADHFAALVRELDTVSNDHRFAILGGPEDKPLGQRIAGAAPKRCLDLTGQVSLLEMVEWIRLCEVMVTNDTGPMHVAAALGRPTVALFGPTEPCRTGPYRQLENTLQLGLPCTPCLKSRCAWPEPMQCLHALPVARVREAVCRKLAKS